MFGRTPKARLEFDLLVRGSLKIEGCVITGTAAQVVAILDELLGDSHSKASLTALPTLAPGEPVPDS